MKQTFFILLLVASTALGGKIGNLTEWLMNLEAGKLPDLTPEQQMTLFGGTISVTGTKPSMGSWLEDIEQGLVPLSSITNEQKMHLFGDRIVMRASENDKQARSLGEFVRSRIIDFPSPVSGEILSLKLGDLFPTNDNEGRGPLKKIVVPVILAMTIIAAIVVPALMTVIKLIAVKGMWSGVVSLIISKLLGLKALLNHHHHHSEDSRRPYFVYLPHGKHRREEENSQGQRQPFDNWAQDNWENWRRDGGGDISSQK